MKKLFLLPAIIFALSCANDEKSSVAFEKSNLESIVQVNEVPKN